MRIKYIPITFETIREWVWSVNIDGQQCYQYQQNEQRLNSEGQQCYQYQQNEQRFNSDGQQC
jgi:hypothetical protein